MAVFPLNHYRATAPPWSPRSESEALTCVGIASPREFNQNLDFQLLWCSEIENRILLPCLLSAVASWKALLTTSCPRLLLAAKSSELALNLKVSCVSAAQSSYSAWPSSAPTSVHTLICCIDLWVSLEQKGLPWFMIRNLKIRRRKKMAFQYETKDIFTLGCWGAQKQHTSLKAKPHQTGSWETQRVEPFL